LEKVIPLKYVERKGWGYSSVVENLPTMRRPCVQFPALEKTNKQTNKQNFLEHVEREH
jgi:hypothetical protein